MRGCVFYSFLYYHACHAPSEALNTVDQILSRYFGSGIEHVLEILTPAYTSRLQVRCRSLGLSHHTSLQYDRIGKGVLAGRSRTLLYVRCVLPLSKNLSFKGSYFSRVSLKAPCEAYSLPRRRPVLPDAARLERFISLQKFVEICASILFLRGSNLGDRSCPWEALVERKMW